MKPPRHLQLWKGSYRIRRVIPDELQARFGKKEFLKQLGTANRSEAEKLAWPILAELEARLERLRSGISFWHYKNPDFFVHLFVNWMSDPDWFRFESAPELNDTVDEFIRVELPKHAPQRMDGTPLGVPFVPEDRAAFLGRYGPKARRFAWVPTRRAVEPAKTALDTISGTGVCLSQLRKTLLQDGSYAKRSVQDVEKAFDYLIELNGDCPIGKIGPAQIRWWIATPWWWPRRLRAWRKQRS